MSDKRKSGVPFESEDAAEQQLWSELENLPQDAPSQNLRRSDLLNLTRSAYRASGLVLRMIETRVDTHASALPALEGA